MVSSKVLHLIIKLCKTRLKNNVFIEKYSQARSVLKRFLIKLIRDVNVKVVLTIQLLGRFASAFSLKIINIAILTNALAALRAARRRRDFTALSSFPS